MSTRSLHAVAIALGLLLLGGAWTERKTPPHFDLLLQGGQILDGSGNPWFLADVGITDGMIRAMGPLSDATATRVIDVRGLTVAPGFIDMHSHAADVAWEDQGLDSPDASRRSAPNLVAQGITSVAINQDGRSPVNLREQAERYRANGIGVNVIQMVGHGSIRGAVLGQDYRRASTDAEIAQMQQLVRQAMEDGAAGLSAGLEYTPGRWASTDEVVALMEVVTEYDGVYISHQRSEGADPMWFWPSVDPAGAPTLIDAILETIEIGERTGGRVVASHVKAKGAHYWGTSAAAAQLIVAARDRGVRVWADQYPYTTSGSDGSTVLIPRWAFNDVEPPPGTPPDYARGVHEVMSTPSRLAALRRDVAHEIRRRGGAGRILILESADSSLVGRTLEQLAVRLKLDPVDAALWLQTNGIADRRGGAHLRGFSMDESDVDRYASYAWVATASDAGIALPEDGSVHPRYWGTFPRKIRRYALERGALTVADAVRSATSLPAHLLGIRDRGLVREGMVADLTVFDLSAIADRATAFNPHAPPEGIHFVFLGGQPIVDGGARTGALLGSVLRPHRP